jgi:hypothetical protein
MNDPTFMGVPLFTGSNRDAVNLSLLIGELYSISSNKTSAIGAYIGVILIKARHGSILGAKSVRTGIFLHYEPIETFA